MKKSLGVLSVFAVLFFSWACSENDVCEDLVSPRLILGIQNQNNNAFALDTLIVSRITTGTAENLIAQTNTDSAAIQLPLTGTLDRWAVSRSILQDAPIDTIELSYVIDYEYVSIGCGAKAQYRNLSITHTSNDLDSVVLLQNEILNETQTTLRVYYTQ